jgi:hypothetical protein
MLARVFSAEPELVAKPPEVEKPVSGWIAASQASSQACSQELAVAEMTAPCWAETWKALSRV